MISVRPEMRFRKKNHFGEYVIASSKLMFLITTHLYHLQGNGWQVNQEHLYMDTVLIQEISNVQEYVAIHHRR